VIGNPADGIYALEVKPKTNALNRNDMKLLMNKLLAETEGIFTEQPGTTIAVLEKNW